MRPGQNNFNISLDMEFIAIDPRIGTLTESTYPLEAIGHLVKVLVGMHLSGHALSPFTSNDLLVNGSFGDKLIKHETTDVEMYFNDFSLLASILKEKKNNIGINTRHHDLELDHLLSLMTTRKYDYNELVQRVLYHPLILNDTEKLKNVIAILDLYDAQPESLLIEDFRRVMKQFPTWTDRWTPDYAELFGLGTGVETDDDVRLMLSSVTTIELLRLMCEIFPNYVLVLYEFAFEVEDLWCR